MNQYIYPNSRPKNHSSRLDTKKLLLFYVLPFIVINGIIFYLVTAKPSYKIDVGETTDYMTTTITLTITSALPTRNLSVSLNAEPLELEKTAKKTYTASITQNGTIEAYLENFNGMGVPVYEHVNILDDNLPSVTAYSIEDGILSITLADSQSGIDFNSIHALTSTGGDIAPQSVDKLKSEVTFAMDPAGLTVYAKDMSGNQMEQPFTMTGAAEEGTD